MFFKIGVVKNFANFTEKQLCWSHFLIRMQVRRTSTLLKRDTDTGVFLVKFLITFFLKNTSSGVSEFLWDNFQRAELLPPKG